MAKGDFTLFPFEHAMAVHQERLCKQLQKAVVDGDLDRVGDLIDEGADVNARSVGGNTPLHWAAKLRHKEIAELLLAEGATINSQDNMGRTPLQLAEENQNKDPFGFLDFLTAKMHDVNVPAIGTEMKARAAEAKPSEQPPLDSSEQSKDNSFKSFESRVAETSGLTGSKGVIER